MLILTLSAVTLRADDDPYFAALLADINLHRQRAGAPAVTLNGPLMKLAGEWAEKNAAAGQMIHRKNLQVIVSGLGYSYLNENLYLAKNPDGSPPAPRRVVTAWMNSAGHRHNLLKDRVDQIGIGIARAADGAYHVVFNGADSHPPKPGMPAGVRFNGAPLNKAN
jgi:uncharacterized protein YkwD